MLFSAAASGAGLRSIFVRGSRCSHVIWLKGFEVSEPDFVSEEVGLWSRLYIAETAERIRVENSHLSPCF
jgi:hypothetical protein